MRTFFDFDSKLKSTGTKFQRFTSLSSLPFDAFSLQRDKVDNDRIAHFERMITKQLTSKFAIPTLTRSEMGALVNVDEALEGIPECYRSVRPIKNVLKLGLNISAQHSVKGDLFAMRAAAIIAVFNLAKQRGQQVQFDICYGYCAAFMSSDEKECHWRVSLQTPTPELINLVMSKSFWDTMIDKVTVPYTKRGAGYQIHFVEKKYPQFSREFDFVLDRLETDNEQIEYARILKQIEHLRSH